MKGVILAGGLGSRLYPSTLVISKHLLPVFDKPMIYYPLSTLIHAGVNDFLIITNPKDISTFNLLLGNGERFGVKIQYRAQNAPLGVAHALIGLENFIDSENFWFILGDNFFHGPTFGKNLTLNASQNYGCHIFLYPVQNPNEYGVAVLDNNKLVKIVEKPKEFISNLAIPGLYYLDSTAPIKAAGLKPSLRNEIEITDLIEIYLEEGTLRYTKVSRGNSWFDLGNSESIFRASMLVQTIQENQGLLIGSPEEASFNNGNMEKEIIREKLNFFNNTKYAKSLLDILDLI